MRCPPSVFKYITLNLLDTDYVNTVGCNTLLP